MKLCLFVFLAAGLKLSAISQNPAGLEKKLRGKWLKTAGSKDTLKFYLDGKGVDLALHGQDRSLLHGYDITFQNDSAHFMGLCVGDQGNKYFRLDTVSRKLTVRDFYNQTNELYDFIKIDDKP